MSNIPRFQNFLRGEEQLQELTEVMNQDPDLKEILNEFSASTLAIGGIVLSIHRKVSTLEKSIRGQKNPEKKMDLLGKQNKHISFLSLINIGVAAKSGSLLGKLTKGRK